MLTKIIIHQINGDTNASRDVAIYFLQELFRKNSKTILFVVF